MHREYLREAHPARLNTLTLTGELWIYLADLNEQAQERLDTIMEQMKTTEGVTEELRQHRAIRQEVSDRIFAPIQSLENEGILYVFLVFQTEEVGQKDGGDSQTQLCGVALKSTSQMEWVQRCNNIHNRAEEIILHEMIYS